MTRILVDIDKEEIAAFCRRWQIVECSLFGSVLRDDFRSDSDVDVLDQFLPEARHTLFDMVRMQDELKAILGREVDLVSRRGIEMSRNYLRKKAILESIDLQVVWQTVQRDIPGLISLIEPLVPAEEP